MNSTDKNRTKNALEWTVFGISLLLMLTTLGMLVNAAIRTQPQPAILRIETGQAERTNDRITYPLTVFNDGGQVAENVDVRVTLGEFPYQQEAGFTLDFIPRKGTREGAVSFQAGEGFSEPKSSIVGYITP